MQKNYSDRDHFSPRQMLMDAIILHRQGVKADDIARVLDATTRQVDELLSSITGMALSQQQDLCILLSLHTSEQIKEWQEVVGWYDTAYGVSLMEVAALNMLDHTSVDGPFDDALTIISRIKK
jgi:hypothetical protein